MCADAEEYVNTNGSESIRPIDKGSPHATHMKNTGMP
jgi:hypothetical protein